MTDGDPWQAMAREWDLWQAAGRSATFWLRDDDATRSGPRLARLLDLAHDLPVGLAVIPGDIEDSLVECLASRRHIRVLQHGLHHTNHAPPGSKKAEFGPHRDTRTMVAELREGWRALRARFPETATSIFVPPWNRIDPALVPALPDCGPALLSVYGARAPAERTARLNTHVDIIDWLGGKAFVGTEAAVDMILRHLADRRLGRAELDPEEPTGILTHHRDHDAGAWDFLETLFARTRDHPAVRWIDPATQVQGRG